MGAHLEIDSCAVIGWKICDGVGALLNKSSYLRQCAASSLFLVTACRLVDTKLLPESMQTHSQVDTEQKNFGYILHKICWHSRKRLLKLSAILPRSVGVGKNDEEGKAYVNILNISLEDRG